MIKEQRLAGVGAIASERAAAVFGLETLQAGIQDHADNTTRFLIVTRPPAPSRVLAGRDANKTTIVFTLPNTPGALFKALSVFALREIDVTKIESRPTGRPWEYLFHLDLAVGQHELRCGRALSHLAEFAPSLKVARLLPRRGPFRGRRPSPRTRAWPEAFRDPGSQAQEQCPDRRAEPRPGARHAEGGRLLRRRPAQAAGRHRQHVDRDRPVQLPPAAARRQGEGRRARGRRHADGVQHGRGVGRHHDGRRGHARLAHQPRGHRRLDRAGRARPSPRRGGDARAAATRRSRAR